MKRLPRGSSRAVLVLFLGFAIAVALIARAVVHDEQSRLLQERASELGAQLTNSITATETNLRSLGTLAGLPSGAQAFEAAASPLLVGPVRVLALLEPRGGTFVVIAAVGDGWQSGRYLSPEREALFRRARLGPDMVSGILHDSYRRRIGFGVSLSPSQGAGIVYEEDAIDPANPIAAPELSPSSQVEVAFFAASTPHPDALVLSSDPTGAAISGYETHVAVGADQWTLVVRVEHPLTGSFAPLVPWLLLAGGMVSALLAAGFVEVLVRRRNFALALVDERTAELQASLKDLEAAQAELRFQAFHDGLTGLPNRVLLMDRIEQALLRCRRSETGVALMFMDLDRFKWVNDGLGHSSGDQLLKVAADRLRSAVRPADTVARLGGDEFVVLCEEMGSESTAVALAQRIVSRLCEPLHIDGHHIRLTVSVGVALASPGLTPYELLRDGDIAMYQAKDRGRDRIQVFERDMRSRAVSRLPAEAALRAALDRGEIGVHYQPVVSPRDGAVVGVEALARWTDSTGAIRHPKDFIGVAEETGLIVALGAVVLGEACTQVARWNREQPGRRPLSASVNLSARQLEAPGLTDTVTAALDSSGLDPGDLWLEITETLLMEERGPCMAAVNALSELGVTLVVDDFGTGYSSLLYLHRLPVNVLKIDQSFVAGMGQRKADDAIVASVVALAHAIDLMAVAEGVEKAEQAQRLTELGCELAQGYYWCKPTHPELLAPWLDQWWHPREARSAATLAVSPMTPPAHRSGDREAGHR